MIHLIKAFGRDEQGQDLIKYSLVIAMIALCCTAIILGTGMALPVVGVTADGTLVNAGNYSAS
jgi:Flp pilus assembly pilin Flp